jgi:hypothetical protein
VAYAPCYGERRASSDAGLSRLPRAFGASGGAAFGALPRELRGRPWAGPVYGLAMWLGFELGIAPVLGLSQAKRVRPVDRLALAGDHLLYGLVLSATRATEPKLDLPAAADGLFWTRVWKMVR